MTSSCFLPYFIVSWGLCLPLQEFRWMSIAGSLEVTQQLHTIAVPSCLSNAYCVLTSQYAGQCSSHSFVLKLLMHLPPISSLRDPGKCSCNMALSKLQFYPEGPRKKWIPVGNCSVCREKDYTGNNPPGEHTQRVLANIQPSYPESLSGRSSDGLFKVFYLLC